MFFDFFSLVFPFLLCCFPSFDDLENEFFLLLLHEVAVVAVNGSFVAEIRRVFEAILLLEFGDKFSEFGFEIVHVKCDEFGVELNKITIEILSDVLLQFFLIVVF